jgi:hypothetical protein
MRNLPLIAIVLSLSLRADDRSKETLGATHTDRFQAPASVSIRLENSFGEVDIDGWERPEVEVTITRSTERLVDSKQHAEAQRRLDEAQRRLDSVHVTAKQDGNDVVISTAYPARNALLHPLSRRSDIGIVYSIKAPRNSKLIVDHKSGGLNVSGIGGDIHATLINGQITLTLADGRPYAIDAQSTIGDVYSDFDGHGRRRQILGQELTLQNTAPATNLYLRVRLGDIVIQKMHGPASD